MPTEELEHELRRAFANAAAAYEDPELACQRLLKRDYRPARHPRHPRHPKRIAAGITAVAAASATAAALTIGSAPPALATVTSALTRTLGQNYHATDQLGLYYITNGRVNNRSHITCAVEVDPARHLEAFFCANGPRAREVGRYTYLYIPDPVGEAGKHWERIPTASVGHLPSVDDFSIATPQQMLSQIKKAEKVTVTGPVSGPGWTGTRYAFTSSRRGMSLSGTVDVDRQGRARALAFTIRFTSPLNVLVTTVVLRFSDFGAPVTVTPPPADQTFPWP